MYPQDDPGLTAKPYADDLDDLPPPIPYPSRVPARASHPILDALAGPIWLAAGMLVAAAVLTSPGCVATGGPTVSAKGEVSVKETSGVIQVAQLGGGKGGNGGAGELSGNFSFEIKWPGK